MATYKEYRNGGKGLALWAEENVWVEIHPEGSLVSKWVPIGDLPKTKNPFTNRSYWEMWQHQKEILYEALEMKDGEFIHRLIVFCWQRGEGKSFLAVLIQVWKFFVWPSQHIVFCANSKD